MRFATIILLALPATVAAQDTSAGTIPIGKDTTIVLGPVAPNGYIDYVRIINERLGKGIRPEDNAMALLVEALGPTANGKPMPAEFFNLLGVSAPGAGAEYFVAFDDYYRRHYKAAIDQVLEMNERLGLAARTPWTAKDNAEIAAWIKSQEKQLAIVVEASKRPQFFCPSVAQLQQNGKDSSGSISGTYQYLRAIRDVFTALRSRAMLRIAEGHIDLAWQDLIACRRLAAVVERGEQTIVMLVGLACESATSGSILIFLSESKLTDKQLTRCLNDLRAIPTRLSLTQHFEACGRFEMLDFVQTLHRDATTEMADPTKVTGSLALILPNKKTERMKRLARDSIDWAFVLRDQVQAADRLARTMSMSDPPGRSTEFTRFADDVRERIHSCYPIVKFLNDYLWWLPLDWIRKSRSMGLSLCATDLNLMAYQAIHDAYNRCEQIERNLYVAIALAKYKLAQNRYPAKLQELVPRYLNPVPDDIFSSKPLIYKRTADGYLLYSVGLNGKDDGGRNRDDDVLVDDIRVRMPMARPK